MDQREWVCTDHLRCPIKDTLSKGHLCIKDTFQCTNLYSGNTSKRGQTLCNRQNDLSQCVPIRLTKVYLTAPGPSEIGYNWLFF